jgi:hypothetical protein
LPAPALPSPDRLLSSTVGRTRATYSVAWICDLLRVCWRRGRGAHVGRVGPLTSSPEYFRHRLLRSALRRPELRWGLPSIAAGPDVSDLPSPAVLATFHIGEPLGLFVLARSGHGNGIVLSNARGLRRTDLTMVDLADGADAHSAAVMSAVRTLRAGRQVTTVVDGRGGRGLRVRVRAGTVELPRGAFAIAQLGRAPIVPITARWKRGRITVITGPVITADTEAGMATAVMHWLEAYLATYPEQALAPVARLLRSVSGE